MQELRVIPAGSELFAVTGGTGFVGGHVTRALLDAGHRVVLIARGRTEGNAALRKHPQVHFVPADLSTASLTEVLRGCRAIAHCAGINRENADQSFTRVHVEGTRRLVEAARAAGVPRLAMLSYLGARPGLDYHESKWQAEEIVSASGLGYTVLRSGLNYGPGDHFLNHLSRVLGTFPVLPLVGMHDVGIRPIAILDFTRVMQAALLEDRLLGQTVAVVGPQELTLTDMVRQVGQLLERRTHLFHLPVWVHRLLAWVFERVMRIPIVSRVQVQLLSEGMAEPALPCQSLPEDLAPRQLFDPAYVRFQKRSPGLSHCLVCIAKGGDRHSRCPVREP